MTSREVPLPIGTYPRRLLHLVAFVTAIPTTFKRSHLMNHSKCDTVHSNNFAAS